MRLPYNAASIVFHAEMTTTTKESQGMTKHSADAFTLGHSPDPDDAFMFYAMAENKIDLRGYRFEHRLEDIQTLNERALRGELHISAISIHAYAYVASKYALLPCGASMGDGYGPIVIRKRPTLNSKRIREQAVQRPMPNDDFMNDSAALEFLADKKVAVPGTMTSAFLALQLFLGEFDYIVVPFDQIFDAVRTGRADVGLIIHEGQLTYGKSGFEKIVDLGKWWKERTGLPLPLGGNVVRKDIPQAVRRDLSEIIRESIDYGLAHRDEAVRHSLPYARDMDAKLAGKFIGMYVNEFTRDYGEVGRKAIWRFLVEAHDKGYIEDLGAVEFVE
jgi:1,4-dihydroxy-6-naphthoate synthase